MKRADLPAKLLLGLATAALPLAVVAQSAVAQTVVAVDLAPDFSATANIAGSNPGNALTSIMEYARTLDAIASVSTDNTSITADYPALSGLANNLKVDGNGLLTQGAVNSSNQTIGLFGGAPATDGAGIVTTEIAVGSTLLALTEGNTIALSAAFVDSGATVASVSGNAIEARALFNAGFNLIESTVPAALAVPGDGAIYDATGSIELDASASLAIVTTQLNNSFSGEEWQPPAGDPILATAVVADSEIRLEATAPDGETFLGALVASDNVIRAVTRGHVNQSAIVLHDQIATAGGTVTGDLTFRGTALIYGLQNSDDVADPDEDFKGQGLHSLVQDSSIVASVANGGTGSTPDPLSTVKLTQDRNGIVALALANDTTNEIAFDPALSLLGPFDGLELIEGEANQADIDQEVVHFQERLGLRDAIADYLIVSRQSMNRRDEIDPVVTALVQDSRIAAEVTTASANSSVSLASNEVRALAEGNAGTHAIHNGEGGATPAPFIDAVAAIVNWQWITAPTIVASIDPAQDTPVISLDVLLTGPGTEAPDDSLAAGAFSVAANVISARTNGNRGAGSIDLEATAMDLALPSSTVDGSTTASLAYLDSFRGATNDGDNFTASAGATLVNFQVLDSAAESHAGSDFLEPALSATLSDVDLSARLELDPTALATGISGLSFAVEGNSIESRAEGNAFDGSLTLSALTAWSGSAGALSTQIDNDQSIEARTLDSDVTLTIAVDGAAGPLDTADLSLFGNRILAVATVNRVGLASEVEGTVIEGAGWRADYDDSDPQTSLSAVVRGYAFTPFRVTRHHSSANGSVAILTDQTADESGVLSEVADSSITLDIEAVTLEASAIDASGNVIASQARINDAANNIAFDAGAVLRNGGGETAGEITLPPGPLATIVGVQGSGRGEVDDPDPERLTEVTALLTDSGIDIDLPELTIGSLVVDQSMLSASAAANVMNNTIEAEAVTIVAGLGDAVPTSQILFNSNNTDYDYSMLASFSILSSQRNESQQFDGEPRGPAVTATLSNADGESAVSVTLENGLDNGRISLDGNSSSAVARGNVANNSIDLEAVTIEGSAHILSRQGNDGDVIATNENGGISLVLNEGGGGALSAGQVSMDNNSIQATAIGNAIVNVVRAKTTGGFTGPGVGDPAVVNADLPIDGEVTVSAGLSVLNSQFNGGTADNWQTISATVQNGQIALNVNGTTSASGATASGNRIDATAIANFASNEVSSLSSGGALPSASVYNRQLNEHSNTTATVTGSGVSFVTNGVVSNSTFTAVGTSVTATAVGNHAVNTITTSTAAP